MLSKRKTSSGYEMKMKVESSSSDEDGWDGPKSHRRQDIRLRYLQVIETEQYHF